MPPTWEILRDSNTSLRHLWELLMLPLLFRWNYTNKPVNSSRVQALWQLWDQIGISITWLRIQGQNLLWECRELQRLHQRRRVKENDCFVEVSTPLLVHLIKMYTLLNIESCRESLFIKGQRLSMYFTDHSASNLCVYDGKLKSME